MPASSFTENCTRMVREGQLLFWTQTHAAWRALGSNETLARVLSTSVLGKLMHDLSTEVDRRQSIGQVLRMWIVP